MKFMFDCMRGCIFVCVCGDPRARVCSNSWLVVVCAQCPLVFVMSQRAVVWPYVWLLLVVQTTIRICVCWFHCNSLTYNLDNIARYVDSIWNYWRGRLCVVFEVNICFWIFDSDGWMNESIRIIGAIALPIQMVTASYCMNVTKCSV